MSYIFAPLSWKYYGLDIDFWEKQGNTYYTEHTDKSTSYYKILAGLNNTIFLT